MKKTTELKIRIAANWIKITVVWAIVTVIIFSIMNSFTYKSDSQAIGFLMLSPLFSLLVVSPLACIWDYRIKRYEHILKREKNKSSN